MKPKKTKQFLLNLIIIFVLTGCCYFFYQSLFHSQTKPSKEQLPVVSKEVSSYMTDIQETIAKLFICESIVAALLISELDLISYYIQNTDLNISNSSRKTLQNCLTHLKLCQMHLKTKNVKKNKTLEQTAFGKQFVSINNSQIYFVDPGKNIQWICTEINQLKNKYTKEAYVAQKDALAEWHNFLIFYTHIRIARLLEQPVSIEPPVISTHPIARQLIEILKQKNYFQGLDIFLQQNGFRNDPNIRGWIFTAIYFDYLHMAYVNGYINMALREFLMVIEDEGLMKEAFPEITPLKNYLILLQRYKIIHSTQSINNYLIQEDKK